MAKELVTSYLVMRNAGMQSRVTVNQRERVVCGDTRTGGSARSVGKTSSAPMAHCNGFAVTVADNGRTVRVAKETHPRI